MDDNFDLKALQEVWQKQTQNHQYTEDEIFQMLKRKSITSVKWILYISLIEVLLSVLLLVYLFKDLDLNKYHEELKQTYGDFTYWNEGLMILSMAVNLYFLYQFIIGYRQVNAQSSVKSLTQNILKFKSVVSRFIYFNLVFIIISSIIASIVVFIEVNTQLNTKEGAIVILVIILILIMMIGIVWLYYYLLYGTFVRRLKKNLKSLSEIK
ncbi:hypothetical protein GO491_08495 [Flavobacteriaceae bacterium Ap0902]|nr:hypothetical protein [Flavobacteriaceae bacterium Ap0902]